MKKEQSSIEWLFEQLPDHMRLNRNGFEMLQQAKELHKKEIEDAVQHGESGLSKGSKQYYNKNFNQ